MSIIDTVKLNICGRKYRTDRKTFEKLQRAKRYVVGGKSNTFTEKANAQLNDEMTLLALSFDNENVNHSNIQKIFNDVDNPTKKMGRLYDVDDTHSMTDLIKRVFV